MLLSEVIASQNIEKAYGVKVDVESFSAPKGLTEISFLYISDGDDISVNLLDTIISYSLTGVDVILDVPFEEVKSLDKLLSLAINLTIDLSILPPTDQSEESITAYAVMLSDAAEIYFSNVNIVKMIYPLTSYIQYMMTETLTDVSEYKPDNKYIIDTFVNKMSVESSDVMKAVIRARIFNIHGGKDKFSAYVKAIAQGVYLKVESKIQDMQAGATTS